MIKTVEPRRVPRPSPSLYLSYIVVVIVVKTVINSSTPITKTGVLEILSSPSTSQFGLASLPVSIVVCFRVPSETYPPFFFSEHQSHQPNLPLTIRFVIHHKISSTHCSLPHDGQNVFTEWVLFSVSCHLLDLPNNITIQTLNTSLSQTETRSVSFIMDYSDLGLTSSFTSFIVPLSPPRVLLTFTRRFVLPRGLSVCSIEHIKNRLHELRQSI